MLRLRVAWSNHAGKTSESDAAAVVESILYRLQEERDAGNEKVVLDIGVYNIVLDAWSRSHDDCAAERAEAILEDMERQCYDDGKAAIFPDESSYNACIKAYVKQGWRREDIDVVSKAQAVLERMLERERIGLESTSPSMSTFHRTRRGYNLVLYALANSSRQDAVEQADQLLETILDNNSRFRTKHGDDSDFAPNINTFSQVLTCWARGHATMHEDHMDARFQQLLLLLSEMNVFPTTDTFNKVMGGWLKSRKTDSLERVLAILEVMEQKHASDSMRSDGDEGCVQSVCTRSAARSDRITINTVVTAYAKAIGRVLSKQPRCCRLIWRKSTTSNPILYPIIYSWTFGAKVDERMHHDAS